MIINALSIYQRDELTLVMPVLNESVRIISAISTLAFTVKVPLRLIIVYDSESDNTIPVVKELQSFFSNISLIKNQGKGIIGAVRTGFLHSNTEVIGIWLPYHLDPYGLINKMYDLIKSKGCYLVSGNRFNKVKRISRGHALKKILSRGGNYIMNRIIGMPLGDITTSIKLYKKEFIENSPIETVISGGWALSTELTIKAAINGYKLGEIEFKPENTNFIEGISNFKVFKQLNQYLKWLYFGYRNRKIIKSNYKNGNNFIMMTEPLSNAEMNL